MTCMAMMSVGMLLRASSSALKTAAFIVRSACSSSIVVSDFKIISDISEFCLNYERNEKLTKEERKKGGRKEEGREEGKKGGKKKIKSLLDRYQDWLWGGIHCHGSVE